MCECINVGLIWDDYFKFSDIRLPCMFFFQNTTADIWHIAPSSTISNIFIKVFFFLQGSHWYLTRFINLPAYEIWTKPLVLTILTYQCWLCVTIAFGFWKLLLLTSLLIWSFSVTSDGMLDLFSRKFPAQ